MAMQYLAVLYPDGALHVWTLPDIDHRPQVVDHLKADDTDDLGPSADSALKRAGFRHTGRWTRESIRTGVWRAIVSGPKY